MKRLVAPLATLRPSEVLEPEGEEEVDIPADANSLDFLRAVYRDNAQPISRRMRAAIAALPFEMPKLAVVATVGGGKDFATHLEAAIARSRGQLIEARPLSPEVLEPSGS